MIIIRIDRERATSYFKENYKDSFVGKKHSFGFIHTGSDSYRNIEKRSILAESK